MAEAESLRDSAPVDDDVAAASSSEKPQALSCLTVPSFSEACGFIDSRYSCLLLKTHRRHLALSPKYLSKKRSGIKENLSAELLKYNALLEGVPVAYDNIKLVGELGDIYDDVGYIHINIQADFVIFQPKCGQRLVGVVNKKAPSHIGCLVHGCFNASIPRPLQMPIDAWQHMEVNIGDQLEFEVFRLDSDAVGVFCIRGKLDRQMEAKAIEKQNVMSEEPNANVASGEVQDSSEIAADETSILSEKTTKKKGKKRLYEETLSQNECLENQQDPNLSLEEAPKKKIKKQKPLEALSLDQSLEVDGSGVSSALQDSILDISNQSEYKIASKKSKKKKHWELVINSDNGVAEDDSLVVLDSMSVVPTSQEHKAKESKKKKHHKMHPDLESSLLNGMMEDSLVSGDGTLEELETELVATKRKHKKKHKNTSMDLDQDLASPETLDDFLIQQETRKIKKPLEALSLDQSLEVDGSGVSSALQDSILDISNQSEYKIANKKSKKKKHRELLINSDNGVAEDDILVELDSMSVVPSSQEHKAKKSKKKQHKIHSDLESSLLNGMTEDSLVSGDGTLEELETELGATKRKHKKKHKNTSMDLDQDLASPETSLDDFLIQQETRKIKKHKKRRRDPAALNS